MTWSKKRLSSCVFIFKIWKFAYEYISMHLMIASLLLWGELQTIQTYVNSNSRFTLKLKVIAWNLYASIFQIIATKQQATIKDTLTPCDSQPLHGFGCHKVSARICRSFPLFYLLHFLFYTSLARNSFQHQFVGLFQKSKGSQNSYHPQVLSSVWTNCFSTCHLRTDPLFLNNPFLEQTTQIKFDLGF